nr:hypothetical protein [Hepelivirales sp.]
MHPATASASNPSVAGDEATLVGKMRGMEIHTPTPAGAAYVNKVTHPPSPRTPSYQGVPDCSAPNAVLLELKAEANFAPVLTRATGVTTTETRVVDKMLFLQSTSPQVGVYCFLGDDGGWVQPQSQPTDASHPLINQKCQGWSTCKGYNFNNFPDDVAQYRTTYKSTTYYLNATDFNNQGTVTCAKFKPAITPPVTIATYVDSLSSDEEIHRVLDILRVDSPPEDDEEFAVVPARNAKKEIRRPTGKERFAKIRAGVQNRWIQFFDISAPGGAVEYGPYDQMSLLRNLLPSDAGSLMVLSPKSTNWVAKDGLFVVQQPSGPTQPWTGVIDYAGENDISPIPSVNTGLLSTLMRTRQFRDGSWTSFYSPMYNQSLLTPGSNNSNATLDPAWSNLDWSFTLFEGLTTATTGGMTGLPYITAKTIVGLEAQPALSSSLQAFVTELPLPDSRATEMVTGIFHNRPDGLPASANDFGTIATAALKFIPTAVDWLGRLFGTKPKPKDSKAPKKQKAVPRRNPAPNAPPLMPPPPPPAARTAPKKGSRPPPRRQTNQRRRNPAPPAGLNPNAPAFHPRSN